MRIQLDPEGYATQPPGFRLIESEVALLGFALSHDPLLIRGEHLCRWAEDFFQARGEAYKVLRSPTSELRQLCPQLTTEQAHALVKQLGERLNELSTPFELQEIARALWEADWCRYALDVDHAASWLVWWLANQPTEAEKVLLEALAKQYILHYQGAEVEVYRIRGQQEALELLEKWLGLTTTSLGWLTFPLSLNERLKTLLKETLKASVVRDANLAYDLFERPNVNKEVYSIAAEILASYYQRHPQELSQRIFRRLEQYLGDSSQAELRKLLPVPSPPEPPSDSSTLLTWYVQHYLPYRLWTHHDKELIALRGRQFAEVYLALYANAISGSADRKQLSWMKAKELKQPKRATLLIILDGLSYTDMKSLWRNIQNSDSQNRLILLDEAIAFAPVPSITECAKPALITGVTPRLAKQAPPLGQVFSKDADLRTALTNIKQGEIYIWRVSEPDSSYHSYNDIDTARNMAQGALNGVIQCLFACLGVIPPEINLQLVITTDHGRLYASSIRSVDVPAGMNSHQRAALGRSQRSYPASGFVFDDEIGYLDGTRFELEHDCAVVLSGATFRKQDGKSGTEAFPHGGIYPEEVLIPWYVIGRDVVLQPITVMLSGQGVSTRVGTLRIIIENPNPVPIVVMGLQVSWLSDGVALERSVAAVTKSSIEVEVSWPTRKELDDGTAQLRYQLLDDTVEQVNATLQLESEEMYERDNPLEDLL